MKLTGEIAASHHERWDGSGYPQGFSSAAIPPAARIVEALEHRSAVPREQAVAEIVRQARFAFDPEITEALERTAAQPEPLFA